MTHPRGDRDTLPSGTRRPSCAYVDGILSMILVRRARVNLTKFAGREHAVHQPRPLWYVAATRILPASVRAIA